MPKLEACYHIKKAYTSKPKAALVEGQLLCSSLVCQMYVFMGNVLQFQTLRIRYTATQTSLSLQSLSDLLIAPSNDLLLLLSGTCSEGDSEVVYGFGVHIVKTSHDRSETCIRTFFQYMPSHRVLWAHPDVIEQPITFSENDDSHHLRLNARSEKDPSTILGLTISHLSEGAASFIVPTQFSFTSIETTLFVKDLELVEVDKTSFDEKAVPAYSIKLS
jgi:hypothetical protein